MRYFLKLAYNGEHYYGWQIQPKQITVEEVLTKTVSILLKEKIQLIGVGRTDTGVHAREFYAHFDTLHLFTEAGKQDFIQRINSFLPKDIVLYDLLEVNPEAHARYDAISRTYRYYISTVKNPFATLFSYRIFFNPDIEHMNNCCQKMIAYTDFTSFSKVHTQTKTKQCHILHAAWTYDKNKLLVFEITADRFLRNMVRAIVGTLLDTSKNKLSMEAFCAIIEQKDRRSAGSSVPANALFLEKIHYPETIFL
jgi:tRNA pseudouridine38-40 synthase